MGRHSSPEQWPFYRSVAGWFLPWVMVAGVVGVALWVAVASLGGDDGASPALSTARSPSPRTEQPVAPPVESPDPVETKKKKPPKEREESEPPEPELITDGITVQILNASGSPGAEQPIADELGGLGFEIVTVVDASRIYEQTTVFWSSEESRAAAEALAGRFEWIVEPKPENLSADVSVHVVVGEDEV
jgi:LytR cell envelope-related transcriptional attenuator